MIGATTTTTKKKKGDNCNKGEEKNDQIEDEVNDHVAQIEKIDVTIVCIWQYSRTDAQARKNGADLWECDGLFF